MHEKAICIFLIIINKFIHKENHLLCKTINMPKIIDWKTYLEYFSQNKSNTFII